MSGARGSFQTTDEKEDIESKCEVLLPAYLVSGATIFTQRMQNRRVGLHSRNVPWSCAAVRIEHDLSQSHNHGRHVPPVVTVHHARLALRVGGWGARSRIAVGVYCVVVEGHAGGIRVHGHVYAH